MYATYDTLMVAHYTPLKEYALCFFVIGCLVCERRLVFLRPTRTCGMVFAAKKVRELARFTLHRQKAMHLVVCTGSYAPDRMHRVVCTGCIR